MRTKAGDWGHDFGVLDLYQRSYWPTVQLAMLRLLSDAVAMLPDQHAIMLGLLIIALSCAAILVATLIR
jgi:hypothetical protein